MCDCCGKKGEPLLQGLATSPDDIKPHGHHHHHDHDHPHDHDHHHDHDHDHSHDHTHASPLITVVEAKPAK